MNLSDINPISALKAVLEAAGVTGTIYEGSKPTSDLPDSYIEIMENGNTDSKTEKGEIIGGSLVVSINVKLLSNGTTNIKKQTLVLKKFDTLFKDLRTVTSGNYHFTPDKKNLIYEGRGLNSGYSTKVLNLLVKTY